MLEAIRVLRRELQVPLIGFAGAPFTLASYAIEGGHSNNFAQTKGLMYGEPGDVAPPRRGCSPTIVADYLRAQVEAGAQAVQVFDSWVGRARRRRLPRVRAAPRRAHLRRASPTSSVPDDPLRHRHRPPPRRSARGRRDRDRRRLADTARRGLAAGGRRRAVQGNLDPTLLFAPRERLLARVDDVLRRAGGRPGHVFNLGHGILPGHAAGGREGGRRPRARSDGAGGRLGSPPTASSARPRPPSGTRAACRRSPPKSCTSCRPGP